jgi:hypothetical protein
MMEGQILQDIKKLAEEVSKDVKRLTETVAENRRVSDVTNAQIHGKLANVKQQIEDHRRVEELQQTTVSQRLGSVEKKVDALSTSHASIKAKMTAFGAIIGGLASEGVRRLFH